MNVRWSVAALALALGAPCSLFGQGEAGIKGGVSFGNISNKGVLPGSLKTRTGFAGGLYVGYRAAVIGLGIEGLYAQRGARSDQVFALGSDPSVDPETRVDFIDVPAYLKLTLPAPLIRPFVYAGPQVSFEIRCRTAGDAACATTSTRKKTDYAAVIGAGVRLGGLGFEARYVYGLRDLKLSTVTSSESFKTRSFMLLASIGH